MRSAAALADIVIVSLHCHESGASRSLPADFIPVFAKAVIDAGADAQPSDYLDARYDKDR